MICKIFQYSKHTQRGSFIILKFIMALHLLLFAIALCQRLFMFRGISSGGLLCVRRSSTNFMTFLLFIVMITVLLSLLFTVDVHTMMAQLNHSCMPHKQYALCTVAAASIVRFSGCVDAVRLCCRLFHLFFLENLQSFVLVLYGVLLG